MKNSPIVPYILIMAMGIGIIFFLSLDGAGKKQDAAKEANGEGAETTEVDGEALAQKNCIGCHGGDLTGASGPDLHQGFDAEHVKDVVQNGKGGMPAIAAVAPGEELDALAEYISGLK